MSIALQVARNNAEFVLERALEPYADGRLATLDHAFGLAASFRARGTCELLMGGVVEPWFIGQMQSCAVLVEALGRASSVDIAASHAAPLWDAIAGEYWDVARELAQLTTVAHNPELEHEDDFLYVKFLASRYLGPRPASEAELDALFERWDAVVEGAIDYRLDLCRALVGRDLDEVERALVSIHDERDELLVARQSKGVLTPEDVAWMRPIWPEGLALVRLARVEGLDLDARQVPGVPPVVRVPGVFVYTPHAWRELELQPARR